MRSSLKFPGGKAPLVPWLKSLMPKAYVHYVEPYFGAGSLLFSLDPEGVSEVANDTNRELMNFWNVLRDDYGHFEEFQRKVEATPVSELEWDEARGSLEGSSVNAAVAFFVRVRQSLAGRGQGFTAISKTRTRRGMNEQASAWLTAIEGLPEVHARLKRVVILNRPALDVIRSEDSPSTLFYLDPPYLHETRNTTTEYGEHEMSEDDHHDLLDVIKGCKGKVMISGYRSDLYDTRLVEWKSHEKQVANHASHAKEKGKEVEVVWTNY